MIRLEEDRHHPRGLDNPTCRLMRIEIRYAMTEATFRWMPSLLVFFALFVELFRPREHGNLDSTGAQVLKESRVAPAGPNTGEIGLPVGGFRRGRRHVRFSVGRPRNPGSRVVQPLCGQ